MKHNMIIFLVSMTAAISTELVGVVTLGQVQLEPSKAQEAFAAIALVSATTILQKRSE